MYSLLCGLIEAALVVAQDDGKPGQAGPNADGNVCHVEGRPVGVLPVEVQKIRDSPLAQPVYEVAQSSAHDKAKAEPQKWRLAALAYELDNDEAGHDGRGKEEPQLPVNVRAVQKAEGRAAVANVDQIEQPVEDGNAPSQGDCLVHKPLARLIENNDQGH